MSGTPTGHNHPTSNPAIIVHYQSDLPLSETPAHAFGPFANERAAREWEATVAEPDNCHKIILDLFIDKGSTLLDTKALAQAIRFVEMAHTEIDGAVWQGPTSEWFDGYAEEIGAQYDLLRAGL